MDIFMKTVLVLIVNNYIVYKAYKKEDLDKTGAYMALLTGCYLIFFLHYSTYASMIGFFILANIVTKKSKKKLQESNLKDMDYDKGKKGGNRNYKQVLANSIMPLLFASLNIFFPNINWTILAIVSIAGSTADTLASEIGIHSKGKCHYLISRKQVALGESGGVTHLGLFASFLGGLYIGLLAVILLALDSKISINFINVFLIVSVGGFIISIVDSILGETLQAKYINIENGQKNENANIGKNRKISGVGWIDNSMVNFLSSLIVSLIFTCFIFMLQYS